MGTREILILCVFVFWGAVAIWSNIYDARLDKRLESMTLDELTAEMKRKGMVK